MTLNILHRISKSTVAIAVHCEVTVKNLQNFNELHKCRMSVYWCDVRKVGFIPLNLVVPVNIMKTGIVE